MSDAMNGLLSDEQFAEVVRLAPLVSIDLVLRDPQGMIFLGRRSNAPAKHFYFVPGGCIWKNETIHDAFARILYVETGCRMAIEDARFLGVFEHFYADDRFGRVESGTHYVVLAYEVSFATRPDIVLDAQHTAHKWMSVPELSAASDVHDHTKAYFASSNCRR